MKLSIKKSDFKFIKDRFMFLFRRESCKRPEGTVSINETAEMRSVQCSYELHVASKVTLRWKAASEKSIDVSESKRKETENRRRPSQ